MEHTRSNCQRLTVSSRIFVFVAYAYQYAPLITLSNEFLVCFSVAGLLLIYS